MTATCHSADYEAVLICHIISKKYNNHTVCASNLLATQCKGRVVLGGLIQ